MTEKQKMLARAVAREFDVPDNFMEIKGRSKRVTMPKQVFSYFLYYKEEMTLNEVGKLLGYDHSTIIYNLKTVDGLCAEEYYKARVDRVADAAYRIYILNEKI